MAFDFTGKTAIVTGGTQGIGLEIAKGIVAGGGHVALIARNAAKGEAAVAELGEGNKFYQLDVADAPKARETVEQIFTDLPQTNILINCAGVISTKKFDEIDDTEWRRTIDINLNGTFTMMNAVYPHFKAAHAGTIVNVSSVAGKIGGGLLGTAAYASSKAGVNGLTKAVAKEGGKFGVRCNAVCPSLTLTDMTSILSDENSQRIINGIPLGRAAQASPVTMYQRLEKPGHKWGVFGVVSLIGNIAIMAFYTVVTGWILYYFVKFLTGQHADFGFAQMIADPGLNVTYLLVVLIAAFVLLSFNLQGGLERVTKYMMSALLVLMLVLAVHSLTFAGAAEGLRFYLVPDFSAIDGGVIVAAMNQAFFSLSVGMGGMAIFGSYIGKDHALMGESLRVIFLDTFVAVLAGIIIFPACFTYGLEVTAGPSLLFDTMAGVFGNMAGGRWWGALFFLFMVFAALSTVLGVCENILAMVRELTGWSRPKGCVVCGVGIFLLALTTALGYSVLHFQPFAPGSAWLDFWDFIVSNNVLPLGSLVLALFCCNRFGWGWDNFVAEANTGRGLKVRPWMKPIFKYFVPGAILFIYIYGMVTFHWR